MLQVLTALEPAGPSSPAGDEVLVFHGLGVAGPNTLESSLTLLFLTEPSPSSKLFTNFIGLPCEIYQESDPFSLPHCSHHGSSHHLFSPGWLQQAVEKSSHLLLQGLFLRQQLG